MNAETFSTIESREQDFIALYKSTFPAVARYVHQKGGTLDEARDIFQDALVIYYEKTVVQENTIETTNEAYIFGIARHLWSRKFKENNRIEDKEFPSHLFEEETPEPSTERITRYLEVAGKKCMALLRAFYYDKLKMREITEQFGFSGERSATVQKHKCIEKLRNEVKSRSLTHADFYE
jgi:DNA-directed RNA polymerase specialized sigma24 family protein